jgi:hypothetical protein
MQLLRFLQSKKAPWLLAALAALVGLLAGIGGPAITQAQPRSASARMATSSDLYGLSIFTNNAQDPPGPGWKFIPYSTYTQMGVNWVRFEIELSAPMQTLDDSTTKLHYETMFSQLHAAGLKVMVLLDYGTLSSEYDDNHVAYSWQCFLDALYFPWVNCDGFVGTAQDYDNDMAHQASILANMGADAPDAYEVWNEPDNPREYVPPQVYTGLYDAVQAAVHAVPGSGPVATGGLNRAADVQDPAAPTSWPSQTSVYATADAIGLHPYGYVSSHYCHCYPTAGLLDNVYSTWQKFLAAEQNSAASIWFTEYNFSWDTKWDNPNDQALAMQDVYSWAKTNNVRVFWYGAQDNPPLVPFTGIFTYDGTPVTLSTPVMCGGPQMTEEGVYQASANGSC